MRSFRKKISYEKDGIKVSISCCASRPVSPLSLGIPKHRASMRVTRRQFGKAVQALASQLSQVHLEFGSNLSHSYLENIERELKESRNFKPPVNFRQDESSPA